MCASHNIETSMSTPCEDSKLDSSPSSCKGSATSKEETLSDQSSTSKGGQKWCDECAEVGVPIAKLMSDLAIHGSLSKNSAEAKTSGSVSKKGLEGKEIHVLSSGSASKAMKLSKKDKEPNEKAREFSENERLQNKIAVLRLAAKYLHGRLEKLESRAGKPSDEM